MNRTLDIDCTMCERDNRLDLHYGIHEYSGVRVGRCSISEEKIQEIIHAKYEDVQKILAGIPVVWKN